MGEFKSFVLGRDDYPEWFKLLSAQGKVQSELDDAGNVLRVKIQNKAHVLRVEAGETIVDTGETIIKLNKEILIKYAK